MTKKIGSLQPTIKSLDPKTAQPLPKVADPVYRSPETRAAHDQWAREVLQRARFVCQGIRHDGAACRRSGVRLFADHIVAIEDGGAPLDPENGQALCGSCHTRKTIADRARRHAKPIEED